MAALTKNSGWFLISYDVIPRGGAQWECHWKYTPLYENARKKTKNALVETTVLEVKPRGGVGAGEAPKKSSL